MPSCPHCGSSSRIQPSQSVRVHLHVRHKGAHVWEPVLAERTPCDGVTSPTEHVNQLLPALLCTLLRLFVTLPA